MNAIQRAIEGAGGPSQLARRLGVTSQAVRFWRDGDRAVPEKHGAEIERACNRLVTRQEIWPDTWGRIWPELLESTRTQAGAGTVPSAVGMARLVEESLTGEGAHV